MHPIAMSNGIATEATDDSPVRMPVSALRKNIKLTASTEQTTMMVVRLEELDVCITALIGWNGCRG